MHTLEISQRLKTESPYHGAKELFLLPCFDTGVVAYKLFSFASGHNTRHYPKVALEGHCKGLRVSWFHSFSHLLLQCHCQHVTFLPAGRFSTSNVWKSHWHTFTGVLLAPRSVNGIPASDFLEFPWHPACHLKLWHLSKLLHPGGHTHPLPWDLNFNLVGRERALPSLSPPWVLSVYKQWLLLHLLVLVFRDALAPLGG